MKVVIAIDSFKGSLTSMEAGNAAMEGIKRACPDAEVFVRPVADGGEGTVDALIEGMNGERKNVLVSGPLGAPVTAEYGITEGKTAVMEMSAAAGITYVPEDKRNPLKTTTCGVGEMICDAMKHGCRKFIIGIGGSATNDGGAGMLQTLGFGLLDGNGNPVPRGAKGLKSLKQITLDGVLPCLNECEFKIACDVKNPLCGENGCSRIFAPQKGADEKMIKEMDGWLFDYANLAAKVFKTADMNAPGAGAAGGLGFAFKTFLNASLVPGTELILKETDIEKYMNGADFVITGEGKTDSQTAMGKAPSGIAKMAKKHGARVIAFGGCVSDDADLCDLCGFDAVFPIIRTVCSLDDAMKKENAYKNMANTAEQVFRLIKAV